jgi:GNAT superfamily N-acetyltransferase
MAKATPRRTAKAATPTGLTIHPLTPERRGDLAALFGTNRTTGGCYCMWFIASAAECRDGWTGGNRTALEALVDTADEPLGLLAYRDGEPVGWCAAGPRSRYARALRSRILGGRDTEEDANVWLVTCFFVHRAARRSGVTRGLLDAAVKLARSHRARAIEGFPLAGDHRRSAGEAFVGVEPLFASCGFHPADRPTPARVVMRRDL